MNAKEFIKQYGWEYARARLDYCKGARLVGMEIDLKQYVDAWELVEENGGLDIAKAYLKTRHIFEMNALDIKLSTAIELVESVNENN